MHFNMSNITKKISTKSLMYSFTLQKSKIHKNILQFVYKITIATDDLTQICFQLSK